ncbi:FtsX-like permease family protein [Rhodanobacter sp. DHB23]|uniref:ABC transporter permease n=1 Tax=Rhodanobacter sp. DHB23 TaxID=2775923 RepID=UPI001784D130|nr:FtsX-like permease family protein [Rhodanobacter sp. DHB23]MBD8871559.1 FtsX-like permease family protein [Rhodanobacter sp. DHB23]
MRIHRQIRPILAALRSHRAAVVLLMLEIALTMAVLGNLVFIVYGTIQRSHEPTGVAESEIGLIQSIGVIGQDNPGTVAGNLAAMRAAPGVADAAYGSLPLWWVDHNPLFLDASRQHPALHAYEFQGSQHLNSTLGLRVVQGHDFDDGELPDAMDVYMGKATAPIPALLTESLARRLYPDGSALGRILYDGTHGLRVIGIVDHLRGELTGSAGDDDSLVYEYHVSTQDVGGGFLVRSQPGRLPEALHAAAAALQKANPGHVQNKLYTMAELREGYFRSSLAAGRMLVAIIVILLVVTALGVSGLASFWVQQRRRQIGMRRALGATRGDIRHYFQAENFLIVTGGVLLGVLFAYALNLFLMQRFELPHLPAHYLLVGAVALWLLGQLAVLGPALRASNVPPVVATRSV